MTSTGQVYPTSASSGSITGHAGYTWITPTHIYGDEATSATDTVNTTYVTVPQFDTGVESYVLYAKGFDFSGIPAGATINGVTCRINAWYQNGTVSLDLVQLLDVNGAVVGTNQASGLTALTQTTSTVITYGSASDLWGNALTDTWVKNANFGVGVGAQATGDNADVYIDYVTLEVEYTPGTPIALADPAVGGDTVNVIAANPAADSGAQTEAATTTAAIPAVDSGIASDKPAISFQLTDSGIAADARTATAAIPETDSSVGSDNLTHDVVGGGVEDSPALEISGFGTFPEIESGDDVTGVIVAINQYASDLTMNAPTYQLWDGITAQIGDTQTGTLATLTTNVDTVRFTGITYSQLATLRVRVYAHGPAGTTHSVDYASLTVEYTAQPGAKLLTGTGIAADIITVEAATSTGDSGAASDIITAAAATALAEAGTGSDTTTVTATLPVADVGTGSDTATVAVTAPSADTGVASDSTTSIAAIPLTDTGAAADNLTSGGIVVTFKDDAAAADSSTSLATIPLAEAAVGAETLALAEAFTVTDSGTAADAVATGTTISLTDTGSASETLSQTLAPLVDSGACSDTISTASSLPLADSGVASTVIRNDSPIPYTDSGVATDKITVAAAVVAADVGNATDSPTITADIPYKDSGAASTSITVTHQLADTGQVEDTARIAAAVPAAENGRGTDTSAVTAAATLTDAATAAANLRLSIAVADNGLGQDTILITAAIPYTDSGALASELISAGQADKSLSDAGAGVDQLIPPTVSHIPAPSNPTTTIVLAPVVLTAFGYTSTVAVELAPTGYQVAVAAAPTSISITPATTTYEIEETSTAFEMVAPPF